MEQYKLDDYIEKIIEVYRVRRDLMIDSMKKYFPKDVKFTSPEG
jgi:2-aminoadipate transaminase